MKLCKVYLPAYNEQENISKLIHSWISEKEKLFSLGYKLIIHPIDDCSKDCTRKIIIDISKKYNFVQPLLHEINKNLGGGLNTAFRNFIKQGKFGDIAVLMDADNTHKPNFVYSMINLQKNENLDCIIASRYRKGSKIVGVPKIRNFLSFGALLYYSVVLGIKNVRDYTCGYRLYTYDSIFKAFKIYGNNFVTERGFTCMMEVLYKLYKIGASFGEVAFELRYDNKFGNSKMNVFSTIIDSFKQAIKFRVKIRKQR